MDSPNVGGPPLTAEGQLRESQAPAVNITRVANVGQGRLQLEMFEAFNIYNRENVRTVDSQWGTNPAMPEAAFGMPLSYFNPREVQLGVRFAF
jgi:hypothetical protein